MNMLSLISFSEPAAGVCTGCWIRFSPPPVLPGLTGTVVLILSLVFIQGCKKDMELESHWHQQDIIVDGDAAEWQDLIWFDGHPVAVGIKNDATDLYLLFSTTDRNTKQTLMRRGFTIWFNAAGKKKKTFGIRYPIGLAKYQQMRSYDPEEWRINEQERTQMHISGMLTQMEIMGPGSHARNLTRVENPFGISLALTDTTAALIYELKIPLQSQDGHPYHISAEPGSVIRMGLETGSMEG